MNNRLEDLSNEALIARSMHSPGNVSRSMIVECARRYRDSIEFKVAVDNICAAMGVDNPVEALEKGKMIYFSSGASKLVTNDDLDKFGMIKGFGEGVEPTLIDSLTPLYPPVKLLRLTSIEHDEVIIGSMRVGGKKPHERVAYSSRGFNGRPKKSWQRNGGKW